MNDVVFYNMWGRERYQDYINLPFKYKEEHEWVTDLQKNNAYFLDHINEYASGPQKADYALTGFLDWYVKNGPLMMGMLSIKESIMLIG